MAERAEFYRPAGGADLNEQFIFDFPTSSDAREYIKDKVDVVARDYEKTIDERLHLHIRSEQLANNRFTNIYDLSFLPHKVTTKLRIEDRPKSVSDFLVHFPKAIAAASGAFLYLADKGSGAPRQSALNLALKEDGVLSSIPVVDREALITDKHGMSLRMVHALGELTVNGRQLSWSGSRTTHGAECTIFGNGNVVIEHFDNEEVGARKERIRILNESSRYTPAMDDATGLIDVGLIADKSGQLMARPQSITGGVDLFEYDAVMRCDRKFIHENGQNEIRMHTVDSIRLDSELQGAISVGPMLHDIDFVSNAINTDPSLGSDPPFYDVQMVRLALYSTARGVIHFRLFDGRPESENFKGVTPTEVADNIRSEDEIIWGCFLDPGRTAKLVAKTDSITMCYGNAHYLQWPTIPGGNYTWVPSAGRPVPSAITLE